ncbi:MAG: hsp70 family protein [Kiritimatiellae bacterium]|nr:hsp70 family protein [Kiritimatiellia bacterium]MDW8458668.1 Hsp70 family protein [Verrucomicrobiota bacterium]
MTVSARFTVGIDLGTTNCAVAYVDHREGRKVHDFRIDQWVAHGVRERRDLLPSFLCALLPHERTPEDERWNPRWRAGYFARDMATTAETRCIHSAKSWLCHRLVDREAPILPWQADPQVQKISPIEAQSILLSHMRTAWDLDHPDAPLSEQEVYLTVPASFDESAREYTLAAARLAGLPEVRLLEEPQAAFYAWLAEHETSWERILQPGDQVWVCDVGGGTTDFTLIEVRRRSDGTPSLHRTAVGEHLILGGDNLDLALALHLEPRWGVRLDARLLPPAVAVCRNVKELFFSNDAPNEMDVALPDRGARLVGGSRRTRVERDEIREFLLNGFLPVVPLDATVARSGSALQVFGLPYARDPAITRHAADFLRQHLKRAEDGRPIPPSAILFNGGFFISSLLRERFLQTVSQWFSSADSAWVPTVLSSSRLDLAVARGAAYFGLVQRGSGVRIHSTLGRAYYLALGSATGMESERAVCIAPADLEPNLRIRVDSLPLRARVNAPVSFQLAHSHSRVGDRAGDIVPLADEGVVLTDSLQTKITTSTRGAGDLLDVALSAELTEIGTLDVRIQARGGPQQWRLTFDARESRPASMGQTHPRSLEAIDASLVDRVRRAAESWFELPPAEAEQSSIFKSVEAAAGLKREDWSAARCRAYWDACRDLESLRRRSPGHEVGWLNLAGYLMRPGYGFPGDDARAQQLWKIMSSGPIHINRDTVRCATWIFWRRLAGGLSRGQQTALAGPLARAVRELAAGRTPNHPPLRRGAYETTEVIRLLASLERWTAQEREALADRLAEVVSGRGKWVDPRVARWALGRLGAREPAYGPLNAVLSADKAELWLQALMEGLPPDRLTDDDLFAIGSIVRRTGDRMRDVSETARTAALNALRKRGAAEEMLAAFESGSEWNDAGRNAEFGEALPPGLII